MAEPALRIDIASDVICPWCFIGERQLARALAMRPDVLVAMTRRPFLLHPEMPAGGMLRGELLRKKFGTDAPSIFRRIEHAGEAAGIAFAFDRIERVPDTVPVHSVIRWAAALGAQACVVERLYTAYFVEGRDLCRLDVLAELAADAGMDRDVVRERLERGEDRDVVRTEADALRRLGVTAAPYFVFDGRFPVVGAQSVETFTYVIDRVTSGTTETGATASRPTALQ